MVMKKVLVSGTLGMDGSHMVDYLLQNTNYRVYGAVRRTSNPNYKNIEHNFSNDRFALVELDITDAANVHYFVKNIQPDYVINFAAQSEVGTSWTMPQATWDAGASAVLNWLEAIRQHQPNCRFYQASSSEMFGDVKYSPQDEKHPLSPRSPYAAAKCAAHLLVKVYRESYGLYAVSGILFNHEGPRRSDYFVTQKIAKEVARIAKGYPHGHVDPIELGNLDAKRDWSYAPDFIDGVWRMLNQEKHSGLPTPDTTESNEKWYSRQIKDYVLASGETHSVREFVELAFDIAGFYGRFEGVGIDEKYIYQGVPLVVVSEKYYRPAEVDYLLGDANAAKKELGWEPKCNFSDLVYKMVNHQLQQ